MQNDTHSATVVIGLYVDSGPKLVQSKEHSGQWGDHPCKLRPEERGSEIWRQTESHAVSLYLDISVVVPSQCFTRMTKHTPRHIWAVIVCEISVMEPLQSQHPVNHIIQDHFSSNIYWGSIKRKHWYKPWNHIHNNIDLLGGLLFWHANCLECDRVANKFI